MIKSLVKITSIAFEENEPMYVSMNAIQILLLGWTVESAKIRRRIESLVPKQAVRITLPNGVWIKFARVS